jgi:GntP family gluconate:H+ symporter
MLFEFELLVLLVMIGTLLVLNLLLKLPMSIATIAAAVAGTLVSGEGIPLRHLFEGCFSMIDMALLIICAMVFMNVVSEVGTFEAVGATISKRFHRYPVPLVLVLMLLMMFPGMITGSANVSVLSSGPIVFPILAMMGLSAAEAGAFLAVGAVLSMAAPPVNIPSMLIANNVEVAYKGFGGPLLFITMTGALFSALYLCRQHLRPITLETLSEGMDTEADSKYGWKLYIPVVFVVGVILAIRLFPRWLPDIGNPLILLLGAVIGCFVGKGCNLLHAAKDAARTGVSIVGKMMAIGMFMQVLSLVGIRGYIVANSVLLPKPLLVAAICLIMPAFGGISVYGSAMLLSGAVVMSMLTGNQVVICAALSLLACIGEVMPPAALSANYSAAIVKEKYAAIMRHCLVPLGFILVLCYMSIMFSNSLGFLTVI